MSEEKLQNLVDKYPQYSRVFREVLNWFATHPKQKEVSQELFYTTKYKFSKEEIGIAFYLLIEQSVIRRKYRVVDEDGSRFSQEFENIDEIPRYVDTMFGEKKDTKDMSVVPFFSLK